MTHGPTRWADPSAWPLLVVAHVSLLLAVGAAAADACSCGPARPLADRLKGDVAVFVGRVESDSIRWATEETCVSRDAMVEVVRAWKGIEPGVIVRVRSMCSPALCGYEFASDSLHLFFTRAHSNAFWTSVCDLSKPLSSPGASADVDSLGAGIGEE